jgi:hypothetical protein
MSMFPHQWEGKKGWRVMRPMYWIVAIGVGLLTIYSNPLGAWPGSAVHSHPVTLPLPQPFSLHQPAQGPLEISRNWAGYISNNRGTYQSIQAGWRVPRLTSQGAVAIWVGLGGAPQQRLLQAGTLTKTTASGLRTTLWLEGLPEPLKPVAQNLSVGEAVHISIDHVKGREWAIDLEAGSYQQTYHVEYSLTPQSAEWIVEDPLINNRFAKFPQFHNIELFYAEAHDQLGQTITPSQSTPIDLRLRGLVEGNPTLINSTTFAVTSSSFSP